MPPGRRSWAASRCGPRPPSAARPRAARSSRSRTGDSRPRRTTPPSAGARPWSSRASNARALGCQAFRSDECVPARVLDAVDEMPVVEPCAPPRPLAHVEADRVHDVQAAAGGCRGAPDRTRVVRDLRMQQHDLEARLARDRQAAGGRRAHRRSMAAADRDRARRRRRRPRSQAPGPQCAWPGSRSHA